MVRSLRKGMSSVHLQYADMEDSIGADTFEAEIRNDVAVLRFRLRPVDSNQSDDEINLHQYGLLSVMIDDEYIKDNFSRFLQHQAASSIMLEVMSRGEVLMFDVKPVVEEAGMLLSVVKRIDG